MKKPEPVASSVTLHTKCIAKDKEIGNYHLISKMATLAGIDTKLVDYLVKGRRGQNLPPTSTPEFKGCIIGIASFLLNHTVFHFQLTFGCIIF